MPTFTRHSCCRPRVLGEWGEASELGVCLEKCRRALTCQESRCESPRGQGRAGQGQGVRGRRVDLGFVSRCFTEYVVKTELEAEFASGAFFMNFRFSY